MAATSSLSSLTSFTTSASALSNLVLCTPQQTIGYQPQIPSALQGTITQPPAFMFNYEGEQAVTLTSDITDHYVENNSAIQDQISLKPEEITTHGFIGELNDITPLGLQTLQTVANKLLLMEAYTPALTTSALIAYDTAFQLYELALSVANSAVSAWSSINNSGGENVIGSAGLTPGTFSFAQGINNSATQNKQQVAFQTFYGYWRARTLFTVQTPWAVFQNMAIKSLRAVQSEETRMITDFEITFKMMRFASTSGGTTASIAQGRAATQSSPSVNNGTNALTTGPSLNSALSGSFPTAFK